jgi:ABC-type nitrate/sulfonate/bicarbonate transport system substrate-binding protein
MSSLYVASEMGYFSDAGLDVEIEPVNNSPQSIPLLAGGKIDVSFAVPSPSFVNAVARGARVRIVAAREVASPGCSTAGRIYGRRDRFPAGLNDPASLKGKQIAIRGRASLVEFALDTLLRHAGLRTEDVRVVSLERSESIPALLSGRIDAIVSGFSFDHTLEEFPQLVPGPSLAQIYPNFQFSHIIFGKNLLEGPFEIGVNFLKAYFRGSQDFVNGKTPRFLEDYARSNDLDFKRLRTACRTDVVSDGHIDAQSLSRFVDWAVDKGYCEASAKVLELTDLRFLAKTPKPGGD